MSWDARMEQKKIERINALARKSRTEEGLTVARTEAYVEELLSPAPQPAARRRGKKPTFILKDVRLFLNTVTRGLSMIQAAGVRADCQRQDTDDAIRLTITIPK